MLSPNVIAEAHARIAPYLHRTPIVESEKLNAWMGHRLLFKAECSQKIGAFKARGALNTLLMLKEQGRLPEKIAAVSTGNHAQAVAWASQLLGVKATVFMAKQSSPLKVQATRSYGADVVLTETRQEAEARMNAMKDEGAYVVPPYDYDAVIAGQGTACFELLQDAEKVDAVFAPCGGGGLLSGTWLATQLLSPSTKVFGGEPLAANDAAQSLRAGRIIGFDVLPTTIADGVVTLRVAERTFQYLQKMAGMIEVSEDDIIYWTQWLTHLLKLTVEPAAAVAMAAAAQWLKTQKSPQTVGIILSGGNVGTELRQQIWAQDCLNRLPS